MKRIIAFCILIILILNFVINIDTLAEDENSQTRNDPPENYTSPEITFIAPQQGVPLSSLESIVVEVIDLENDVESVTFYYSSDNLTWELIDSKSKPEKENLYLTIWNTEEMYNGEYYIKVRAIDKMGNLAEITEGPFEITQGLEKEKKPSDGGGGNITNETRKDKDEEKGFLPGFELITILIALIISFILYRRRIK